MKPSMSSKPLSLGFSIDHIFDHLEPQPNGLVTAINLDGTVVSIQPNGTMATRDPGTAGAWEVAKLDGNLLIYYPSGQPESKPFAFLYTPNTPNT